MDIQKHKKADTIRENIEKLEKHIKKLKDLIKKIEGYALEEEANNAHVGIYNERVCIGKENALIILKVHKAQSGENLLKLELEYSQI